MLSALKSYKRTVLVDEVLSLSFSLTLSPSLSLSLTLTLSLSLCVCVGSPPLAKI